MKEFEKFVPKENFEPKCDICGGAHKTSHHGESLLGKTELMNPVCEICKGGHKTSRHDEFQKEESIYPVSKMPSTSGGGVYFGFFTAEDVVKIETWLLERGAECKNR